MLTDLKGGPGRVREDVPLELVKDEVAIAAELVDWLAENAAGAAPRALEDRRVCLRVSDGKRELTVSKGLPASDEVLRYLRLFIDGTSGPGRPSHDELIGLLVQSRLPITGDTATKAPGRSRTFGKEISDRPMQHRLLASLFLDLAWSSRRPDLQACALDALLAARYHVLMLYYLAQLAHIAPAAKVVSIDEEGIRRLCDLVDPSKTPGPFSTASAR